MIIKKIFTDYSEYTGLRHCSISDNSGEDFYHKHLNDWFKEAYDNKEELLIDLDYADGYASSFLDEAFGKLVYDFTLEVVKKLIKVKSEQEPHWKAMIEDKTFNQWEKRRISGEQPIVTKTHKPWYRNIDGNLVKKVWEVPSASAS